MNELRQEFEALCERNRLDIYGEFANGAWWAYQEQHKKLVAYREALEIQRGFDEANDIFSSVERIANSALHHGEYLVDTSTLGKPQQSATIALDDDKIKEIFMVNSNELHNNR